MNNAAYQEGYDAYWDGADEGDSPYDEDTDERPSWNQGWRAGRKNGFDESDCEVTMDESAVENRLAGILLGTAVGDALGLPAEGLTPRRRRRLFPGSWRHRFLLGHGMISDDTEHALLVAQSLLNSPADPAAFQRNLARHLRWWFLGLPAGIGLATARACVKLCMGFPPNRSGVFSAGNGPAMRTAIIGGYFCGNPTAVEAFVRSSTEITHIRRRWLGHWLSLDWRRGPYSTTPIRHQASRRSMISC